VLVSVRASKRGGHKRTVNRREVANGLMDILSTGCQWAAIPKDLPPCSTLHDDFDRWDYDATRGRIPTRSLGHAGSWRGGTPARALRSSIARASRAQKKGEPP